MLLLALLLGAAQVAGAVHGIEHGGTPVDKACAQCLHGSGAGAALPVANLVLPAIAGRPAYRIAIPGAAAAGAPEPYHSRAPPRCSY